MNIESQENAVDLTFFEPIHQGKWAVLSRETHQLYAYDESPKVALERATKLGCTDPILHKVMPFDKGFMS